MGGGRGRTQRRHFRQSRENIWKKTRTDASTAGNPAWEPFATQNSAFEEYYKEQHIVPEEEWDNFMTTLRTPLPAAFRINPSDQFCQAIISQLENDFVNSLEAEVTSEDDMAAIRPLPWYPDKLAWHLNFSRMQLRKNQTLHRFHEFLKLENEMGSITRQEAVSMIPPLLLDVRPEHFVLDMCAAPGSKTFQLLEMIHQLPLCGSLPDGLVVANDADVQRCNLLIHQTKRMCSANLIVTNHEAQHFPSCSLRNHFVVCKIGHVSSHLLGSQSGKLPRREQIRKQLLFDRILCDVPCTGDGTLRKAPDIWRKWNSGMGNGLHHLQVQIAMRGLELLKVGGRMVYSTCSLNPIENEAVVAEVLRKCGGSVKLVDVSTELPQLARRPGLRKWKVRDKGTWLSSYEEVESHRMPSIVSSMFSGHKIEHENSATLEANVATVDARDDMIKDVEMPIYPLEYCMRIMPHDQNTGAFFIGVLEKLRPLPAVHSGPVNPHESSSLKTQGPCESLSNSITDGNMVETRSDEYDRGALEANLPDRHAVFISGNAFSGDAMQVDCISDVESCGVAENDLEVAQTMKKEILIKNRWRGVDPVVFFQDDVTINSLRAFYGISKTFQFDGHLVARNTDVCHVKRLYYVSRSVRDTLGLNFKAGHQMKITSLGLKIFERQTSKGGHADPSSCAFRISSEGLSFLLPYITKQILLTSFADFEHLLKYRTIKFGDFVDPDVGIKASNLMPGCCIIILNQSDRSDVISMSSSAMALGGWKGRTNISIMVSEVDSRHLLQKLEICFDPVYGKSEAQNVIAGGVVVEGGNQEDDDTGEHTRQ